MPRAKLTPTEKADRAAGKGFFIQNQLNENLAKVKDGKDWNDNFIYGLAEDEWNDMTDAERAPWIVKGKEFQEQAKLRRQEARKLALAVQKEKTKAKKKARDAENRARTKAANLAHEAARAQWAAAAPPAAPAAPADIVSIDYTN